MLLLAGLVWTFVLQAIQSPAPADVTERTRLKAALGSRRDVAFIATLL
jgi:hypothetical protein